MKKKVIYYLYMINNIFHLSEKNYKEMVDDIIKASTILFVVEGTSYLAGKKENAFTPEIVQLLIYIIVGIIVYWAIVKNIITKLKNN